MRPSVDFYLFSKNDQIEIRMMTPEDAAGSWDHGEHWLGAPQKTRSAASELRNFFLREKTAATVPIMLPAS